MHQQDAEFAIAGQPGRLHEAGVAAHIGFRAGDAGIEREIHDRGRDDDVLHGVAEGCDDAHRQHEQRKGHDGVGDAADDAVGPAAEITGGDTGKAPIRNTSTTEATAIKLSSRVATMTRLKMSRPSWSVPNQCAADGGFSAAAVSEARGS